MLPRLSRATERKHARLQRSEDARLLGSLGASKGGIARAKSLSPETRSAIAQKAANARWNNGS